MKDDTIKNLLPKFLNDLSDKGRSPSTALAYRADLEQMVEFFTHREKVVPDRITQELIESFRDSLLTEKYTPKTVSRKLNAVKTFFRYLVNENFLTKDPSLAVAHPKIDLSVPKFLSQMEYRALRDVVREDERIAAMIELMLQTGIRISEVAALKRDNIKDDSLIIESYATQPQRTVPLNKKAKEAIERYIKIKPKSDSPFLFISKNSKPLAVRNIRAAIDRFMSKAEITGFSVNDLRTTFMVHNLKAGVDLVLLSQVSGHKRLSTTERYLSLAGIKEPGKRQQLEEL